MAQSFHANPAVQEALANVRFAHVHRPNRAGAPHRELAATLASTYHNGEYVVAGAYVHPRDNGSRRIGRDISRGHLAKVIAFREGLADAPTFHFGCFPFEDELRDFIKGMKDASFAEVE